MATNVIAKKLGVNGIVQGVGFRPFVYNLANYYGLKGEVANTSAGVSIHVEGPADRIACFEADLVKKSPPLAQVVEISGRTARVKDYSEFSIVRSRGSAQMSTLIPPDVAVCADCLQEMLDPRNRRFRYPFINCTNCGPRYTIIDNIPYDRPHTSMRHFCMCAQCQAEYDDPGNRRFHAQPNACALCGPHVSLCDNNGTALDSADPIANAAELLKQGYIVAIKGLGGYHLAADAENTGAVVRLRQRKLREEKPFAVMSYDLEHIRRYATVTAAEQRLLTAMQRPIVLISKKKPHSLSEAVAPRNSYFGVMLPYTPLHFLLLANDVTALVMTSGNLSEEPIAIDNGDAFERLAAIADYFLIHNRDIYWRSDDSIVRHAAGKTRFIRRSRGFVPIPVFLKHALPAVLACGAELKNTICITKGDKAFLSQHIGDLENLATLDFFERSVAHLQRILEITPEIIAHDAHPDYLSTQWATEQQGVATIAVYHHHAHIVSCMAEHRLEGPAIGLSFDGTGYGPDHSVWGGEVLVADDRQFERVGHFKYVPMPGSTAAIKEPWRMAVSYLHDAFGDSFWNLNLPLLTQVSAAKITTMIEMMATGINCPQTSSLGRLFDGVAAITGICQRVNFEGQAAMELEMRAAATANAAYDLEWQSGSIYRILTAPIIRGVVADLHHGKTVAEISAKFHLTIIQLFTDLCDRVRRQYTLNRVVLSGGCFQNTRLLTGLIDALQKIDFEAYAHQQVPTNDGGIALGQAVVAAAISRS